MATQSTEQKKTVKRVMHEFKSGELETSAGEKVRNPKQAVAIGLSEAGASNEQAPAENRHRLTRTKTKERQGKTAQQAHEGKTAMARPKRSSRRRTGWTLIEANKLS